MIRSSMALPTSAALCRLCAGTGRTIDHEALGRKLRAVRERAHLTQWDVADALGVDQSFVSYLEQGARVWNPALVEKYLAACRKGGR